VVGVKQSAGDMKLLARFLLGAPRSARILSAVDALMCPTFALGAHGAVAGILTGAPMGSGPGRRTRRGPALAREIAGPVERVD
jgi:4-hydroxy-tetrahydrodipicolinate synthase